MKRFLTCDVGVFASNEEQNIAGTIKALQKSRLETVKIRKIIVVSSGSLDKTNSIVRQMSNKDQRIQLVEEAQRTGKSKAVNLFIEKAKAPILMTVGADVMVSSKAIEAMGEPFWNEEVGMVGGHPVSRVSKSSDVYAEVMLLWELHHEISLLQPKCGELVAFRNVIRQIPPESAVDEATIEVLLRLIGYSVVYAPRAIAYNRGPKTVSEFLIQRRRVFTGHEWVQSTYQYKVVTMMPDKLLRVVLLKVLNEPQTIRTMIRLVYLEAWGRLLGWIDYHIMGKNPYVWQMISRR